MMYSADQALDVMRDLARTPGALFVACEYEEELYLFGYQSRWKYRAPAFDVDALPAALQLPPHISRLDVAMEGQLPLVRLPESPLEQIPKPDQLRDIINQIRREADLRELPPSDLTYLGLGEDSLYYWLRTSEEKS